MGIPLTRIVPNTTASVGSETEAESSKEATVLRKAFEELQAFSENTTERTQALATIGKQVLDNDKLDEYRLLCNEFGLHVDACLEAYAAMGNTAQQVATSVASHQDTQKIQARIGNLLRNEEILVAYHLALKLPVSIERDQALSDICEKAVELESYEFAYKVIQEKYANDQTKFASAEVVLKAAVKYLKLDCASKILDMAPTAVRECVINNLIDYYQKKGKEDHTKNVKTFQAYYNKRALQNTEPKQDPNSDPKLVKNPESQPSTRASTEDHLLGSSLMLPEGVQDHFLLRAQWIPYRLRESSYPEAAKLFQEMIDHQNQITDKNKKFEYHYRLMKLASDLARDESLPVLLSLCEHLQVSEIPSFMVNVLMGRIERKEFPPVPDFAANSVIQDMLEQASDISTEAWNALLENLAVDQIQPALQRLFHLHVDKKKWQEAVTYANGIKDLVLRCQCYQQLIAKYRASESKDLAPLTQVLDTIPIPIIRACLLITVSSDQSLQSVASSLALQGGGSIQQGGSTERKRKADPTAVSQPLEKMASSENEGASKQDVADKANPDQ